jgi:glycosyltransferase involved in cell wall biosynthesis
MANGRPKVILIVTTHFSPRKGGVETHNKHVLDFLETQTKLVGIVLTYQFGPEEPNESSWRRSKVLRIRIPEHVREFMVGMRSITTLYRSSPRQIAYLVLHLCYLSKGAVLFFGTIRETDVVVSNGALIELLFGYALAVLMRKKLVVWWHSTMGSWLAHPVQRCLVKLCLSRAASIGVNGLDIMEQVIEFLGTGKKSAVFLSRRGVDGEDFRFTPKSYARTLLGLPDDSFVVLYAATLTQIKFCDLVIGSANMVLARDPSFLFVFIGQGPLEPEVRKLEAAFSRNIRFIESFVDAEKLGLFINASDLVVGSADTYYPSRIVLESFACGTPVLVFDASILRTVRGPLRFHIPLPHFLTVGPSDELMAEFLLDQRLAVQRIKNSPEFCQIARKYVMQNYDKYAATRHDLEKFNL